MHSPGAEFVRTVAAELPAVLRQARVTVAVSGGADSMALLRALLELRGDREWDLHVAHLNHGLRGEAAVDDANWLEAFCRDWALPFHLERVDVCELAAAANETIEEAARKARYRFFRSIAAEIESEWIAVAHTADDQAETILHHVLRGTGVSGLKGMPRCRLLDGADSPRLVRPLLSLTRAQVEQFLADVGQSFRADETNTDERFTRNRIRHQLLPLLRSDYNSAIDDSLRRLGRQAEELEELLEELAARLLEDCLETSSAAVCRLNVDPLRGQPRHVVREMFRLLWKRRDWPRQRMGFVQWDRLAGLIDSAETIELPGSIRAQRRGGLLVLSTTGGGKHR